MLIEGESFGGDAGHPLWSGEPVFRFCQFDKLNIEGASFEGALLWSALRDIDWYWGLFNTATIVGTRFERCVFRGASFRGARFVKADFIDCRFALDNLGGACLFDDCSLTECRFERCVAETAAKPEPLFQRTRLYGCDWSACRGLEPPAQGLAQAVFGKRRRGRGARN